jgi:nitrate reductase delta subunit
MIVLRALGALLTYPSPELLAALAEIRAVLAGSPLLDSVRRERLETLIAELSDSEPLELEQRYVSLFDTGRSTCLWLFEHVHGESRERGQAMVDLRGVYERAGFQLIGNELPDYLPAVLEYLSCRELPEVRDMLADCAHILRKIGERLATGGSHYAAVFDALLVIAAQPTFDLPVVAAREPASAVDMARVDEEWMDAPAFAGGQQGTATNPGETPIRFMPLRARHQGEPS